MKGENVKNRIVIADPQYLTCIALELILQEIYDIVFVCNNRSDLLHWIKNGKAELVIFDHILTDFNIVSGIKNLIQNISHIMIFTNEVTRSDFKELTRAGIQNMVLKSTGKDELLHAVDMALKGKKYYSDEILQMIVENNTLENPSSQISQLTTSEMEIVKLIAEGLTTKDIAARKLISFHTVITHRKNIFRKTGVNSVSELIMYAIKAGWIDNIEYYI